MPAPRRIARLKQLILEVAATTLQRDVRDPRLGFVTVTRVDLAPDLTQATVFWSCLGTDAQRRTSERALEDARGMVQSTVARALATRTTPTLSFRFDPTLAKAQRLESIFETLRKERPAPAETPLASSPRLDDGAEEGGRQDDDATDDRHADDEGSDDRASDEASADDEDDGTADDRATDEDGEDEDEHDDAI